MNQDTTYLNSPNFFTDLRRILKRRFGDNIFGLEENYEPVDEASLAFGRYLQACRTNKGLTQEELSQQTGVPEAEIYALEKGIILSTQVRATSLHSIARVFDEDTEFFGLILGYEIPAQRAGSILTRIRNEWKAGVAFFGSPQKLRLSILLALSTISILALLAIVTIDPRAALQVMGASAFILPYHLHHGAVLISIVVVLLLLLIWLMISHGELALLRLHRLREQRFLASASLILMFCLVLGILTISNMNQTSETSASSGPPSRLGFYPDNANLYYKRLDSRDDTLNPFLPDTDGDGLKDAREIQLGEVVPDYSEPMITDFDALNAQARVISIQINSAHASGPRIYFEERTSINEYNWAIVTANARSSPGISFVLNGTMPEQNYSSYSWTGSYQIVDSPSIEITREDAHQAQYYDFPLRFRVYTLDNYTASKNVSYDLTTYDVPIWSSSDLSTDRAFGLRSLAWSPDGHHLLTSSSDGTVRLWDPSDLEAEPAILTEDFSEITEVNSDIEYSTGHTATSLLALERAGYHSLDGGTSWSNADTDRIDLSDSTSSVWILLKIVLALTLFYVMGKVISHKGKVLQAFKKIVALL